MPLIACPDCGKQVSEQAPSCPQCGRPIATQPSPAPVPAPAFPTPTQVVVHQPQNSASGGFGQGFGCVFGVIAAVIVLAVAVSSFKAVAKCSNCDGTGRVWGGLRECPDCKGRGVLGK